MSLDCSPIPILIYDLHHPDDVPFHQVHLLWKLSLHGVQDLGKLLHPSACVATPTASSLILPWLCVVVGVQLPAVGWGKGAWGSGRVDAPLKPISRLLGRSRTGRTGHHKGTWNCPWIIGIVKNCVPYSNMWVLLIPRCWRLTIFAKYSKKPFHPLDFTKVLHHIWKCS